MFHLSLREDGLLRSLLLKRIFVFPTTCIVQHANSLRKYGSNMLTPVALTFTAQSSRRQIHRRIVLGVILDMLSCNGHLAGLGHFEAVDAGS